MGLLYAAKGELQAAADAAAMAAARSLVSDSDGDGLLEGDYSGAETTAHSYTTANKLLGDALSWTGDDQFEAGKWDFTAGDFEYTGDSVNSEDLDTARVVLRRDVSTYFIKIFGIDQVEIAAKSTGYLGCAGTGGRADLPIAVKQSALVTPGNMIEFNDENNEDAQWTCFFEPSCNASALGDFLDGSLPIPPINIGDIIELNNGTISSALAALKDLWDDNKDGGGEWSVMLPVYGGESPIEGPVVGFVRFVITDVTATGGDKGLTGYWPGAGEMVAPPGAASGGECYGVRASQAAMIN